MKQYNKYKDSGIDWIGEIPEHWEDKKFKFIYQFSMGATILKTDLKDNGRIPVYSATESDAIFGYVDETNVILEENDFVIPARGNSIGHIYLVKQESTCTQTTIYAKDKKFDSSIPKFIFYYQKGLREHLFQFDRTAIPQITVDQVKNNILLIPPKPEQTAIANFLDRKTAEIDNLITKKEKLLKLYDEEKTAVINQAVTKGVPRKDGRSSVSYKDSGIDWLGEIPVHWEVKKLKYVLNERMKYGANESALYENRNDPRYIRITDFGNDGKLRNNTFKSLPPEVAKDYMLKQGDILFARSGATVGKTFQFKDYNGMACFAGYLIKASPNYEIIISDFLYLFTKTSLYERWKESIFNQATIQNIGADKYVYLNIPIPKTEEQTAIVKFIETELNRINAKAEKTKKLIDLLVEYKQSLISEVVTGKLKVI